jgi:hypothetical protein
MGRRERESKLEGVNLLGLAPVRIASWEEVDGRVVVLRPYPDTRGVRGFLDRFFHRMSANRIRLDEIGTVAWKALDGERTVSEVADVLREAFGEAVDPVEERLGHLVWLLRKEGMLAYPGWDEVG